MKKIIELKDLSWDFFKDKKPIVVIGFFDGVHKGHQKIIHNCIESTKENRGQSVVFTFKNPPANIVSSRKPKKLILPFEEKIRLINGLGIDHIVATSFDKSFSELSPHDFCQKILLEKLNAFSIIVGQNFRFGHNGKGDIRYLVSFFKKLDVDVNEIKLLRIGDTIVSSTNIRKLIKDGKICKASLLLGREPYIIGKVIKEKGLGKKIGFPTVNIKPPDELVLPKDGVYAGMVEVALDQKFYSVINVGKNPTFDQKDRSVEAHILDFKDDIYGRRVKISFYKRIRDEKKFLDHKHLVSQIEKDVVKTRDIFKKIYATNL